MGGGHCRGIDTVCINTTDGRQILQICHSVSATFRVRCMGGDGGYFWGVGSDASGCGTEVFREKRII